MGIPHLATFLRPYGELSSLAKNYAVIDGPGLAYHVYYLSLSNRPSARNSFEAAPSYEEIGKAVIAWLDGLQTSGVTVQKIYFDGYLPPSKLDIRFERLRVQTKRLNDYYHANPVPCRSSTPAGEALSPQLFVKQSVHSSHTNLSSVPLLVPAVIDALKASPKYSDLIVIVPGEADLYCAEYLRQHGGIVLTGDSDLLVHELGSNGAVCFFKDVEIESDYESSSLNCQLYNPSAIADRLALPKAHGLRALAFEIIMDIHGTFKKLLMQAVSSKSIISNQGKYKEFCREYEPPIALPTWDKVSGVGERANALQALQSLDPRVSEFVLQFPIIAALAGLEVPDSDSRHVFLPFLLDCPVRTNAWEASTSVRQLAYGLVNFLVPEVQRRSTMCEHRRRQNNSKGREWQLPMLSEIPEACSVLVATLDQLSADLVNLPHLDLWTAYAVFQDAEYSAFHDKPTLTSLALQHLFHTISNLNVPKSLTWDVIQFHAQLEGSYYSLRILKQILGLLVCNQINCLSPSIFLLHERLKPLPTLDVCQSLIGIYSMIQLQEISIVLKAVQEMLGVTAQQSIEMSTTQSKFKNPRKRQKKDDTSLLESSAKLKSNNPFHLLDTEQDGKQ